MSPSLVDRSLLVFDDCLDKASLLEIRAAAAHGHYRSVHFSGWDKPWRLWDGQPLRGEGVYYDPKDRFRWRGVKYPTRSALDALVDRLRSASANYPMIVGREGSDWDAIFLSPWVYPVGSALSPHRDADRYAGSFTFFLHERWSPVWGGELIVVPEGETSEFSEEPYPWLSGDVSAIGNGIEIAITPTPNRLALIGPDRSHRIARVDANAGAHVRLSIAGFFFRI